MCTRKKSNGLMPWILFIFQIIGAYGLHALSEKNARISMESNMHFTQAPLYRRDESACPPDYSLCPQSLNGGCCPNGRSCGMSSCYAITAAPLSVCSSNGYIACGVEEGGMYAQQ